MCTAKLCQTPISVAGLSHSPAAQTPAYTFSCHYTFSYHKCVSRVTSPHHNAKLNPKEINTIVLGQIAALGQQ